jgi:hypothetical protein
LSPACPVAECVDRGFDRRARVLRTKKNPAALKKVFATSFFKSRYVATGFALRRYRAALRRYLADSLQLRARNNFVAKLQRMRRESVLQRHDEKLSASLVTLIHTTFRDALAAVRPTRSR